MLSSKFCLELGWILSDPEKESINKKDQHAFLIKLHNFFFLSALKENIKISYTLIHNCNHCTNPHCNWPKYFVKVTAGRTTTTKLHTIIKGNARECERETRMRDKEIKSQKKKSAKKCKSIQRLIESCLLVCYLFKEKNILVNN